MSPFSKKSFDSSKCVSLLNVTREKIGILTRKRSIIVKQSRDDVARLLERGQDANAAARAEHVFREENIVGAYELLEKHCQLVIKGISAIKSQKECSSELKEAIASLIYAAPRCGDLQELQKVRDIFISRYGAEYITAILELRPECAVNTQIIQKLSSRPPNSDVRLNLLKGIALEHKINWNYQRAVAASFTNGEVSEKAKVSPSASQASNQGLNDDKLSPSSSDAKSKEPATSLAAQCAIPPSVDKSAFVKTKQTSDVSEDSANKLGNNGQASSARHNSAPSMVHDVSPRERDVFAANKSSSIGSRATGDESMHHDRPKENASLPTCNSAPPTMHRAEPRKEEFKDTKQASAADQQKPSLFFMHRDDERRGHPSSGARKDSFSSATGARHEDHLARPDEHTSPNVEYSAERALHPIHGNRALPSKSKWAPVHLSADARVSESPGVLGGPMQQAASSTPTFDQAKVFSPKPEPHSSSESLAAEQYVRAQDSYIKVDRVKKEEDLRGKDLSQIKYQLKQGASNPKADSSPNNMADVHIKSVPVKHFMDYKHVHEQAQDQKSSFRAMNGEEVSNSDKDHARGESRRMHHQRLFSAEVHERSRGVDRIPSYPHANYQHDENLSARQEYSTAAGRNTRVSVPPSELRSMQAKVDQELADLENAIDGNYKHEKFSARQEYTIIAGRNPRVSTPPSELSSRQAEVDQELADLENAIASAARAADVAMDMVRSCSIRSRADKKGSQKEYISQTHKKNYSGVNLEIGSEARKAFHDTLIHTTAKGHLDHKEPYQEQEPVALDSEMPHFDDYTSDESEEPPLNSNARRPLRNEHVYVDLGKPSKTSAKSSTTPFGVRGRHDLSRETLHVSAKRNLQKELLRDDDCAESVDSFSPKSSSSSYQHSSSDVFSIQSDVQPFYKSQLDEYEEPDNASSRSRALPFRSNVYAADEKFSSGRHGIGNSRYSDMKFASENADKGALKCQGSAPMPTGDAGKKKWTLGNAQPPSQHYAATDQSGAGKPQGVSRRSVRSLGPT